MHVHPSAVIDDDVVLGEGTRSGTSCTSASGARIGAAARSARTCSWARACASATACEIQNNVSLYEGVEIEDDVFLGPICVFTNVINPRAFVERKHEFRRPAWAAAPPSARTRPSSAAMTSGEYCFVGAGAVVTRGVPPYALVVGDAGQAHWAGYVAVGNVWPPHTSATSHVRGARIS